VVVDAEIVDPTDEARRHALPEERASASDPSAAVSRIASRAAAALAAHQDPDWTAPWYYTIPTLEAHGIVKRGDSLFAQGKQDESLPFFYEAYAADTMYLSPLFTAAAVHGNMGRPTLRDSILDHIEARADLLTELEHFNIPWYRGTPEEALGAAKGAAALDPLGWTYAVGFRANWAGHFPEAVEWLSRRPQLEERGSYWARTWTPFRSQYMMALHAVGDHETELAEAQQARVDFADNPWWIWSEMRARAALGQVEAVRAQYDTTVTLLETNENASHWENLEDIATELKVHGNPDAGQALMETVVAHYREVGNTVQLGDALGFAGHPDEAYRTLAPLMDGDPSVDVIGWYGAAAAISGETVQAEETLARLEGHATAATGNNLRYQAAIHGALGHCDRAIELYRQATEAGFAYHQAWGGEWWHRDWDTEPVRANCPQFSSLLDKW
jgi:tetratricopeptide (TPR) repeat protein